MKVFVAVLGCLFVAQCMGTQVVMRRQDKTAMSSAYLTSITRTSPLNKFNICPLCIDFADESIEMLEDIVLEVGVLDSCEVLCEELASKTSQLLGVICNFLCDIEGINEFVKALQTLDLDDIYFCELIKGCPIFDQGDSKITEMSITPVSGPQGKREIDFTYVSKNGTGTGQIDINIITIDKVPLETRQLNEAGKPGTYPFRFVLDAEVDPNCDPTQQPCEKWKKGNYTLVISICNGECGSKHPHSKVYDTRSVEFTITGKKDNSWH